MRIVDAATLTLRLQACERAAIRAHLLSLDGDDRRLRFGHAPRDAAIERYVNNIDFQRDAVFGVRIDGRNLDGIVHLALQSRHAEMGVSVLKHARRRGIGSALVSRAAVHARARGVEILFMYCLSENRAIMRIARSLGMQVVSHGSDSEASIALPAADAAGVLAEQAPGGMALWDAALKPSLPHPSRAANEDSSRGKQQVG